MKKILCLLLGFVTLCTFGNIHECNEGYQEITLYDGVTGRPLKGNWSGSGIVHSPVFCPVNACIYNMEKGKIMEEGTHEELKAIKGKYFRLIKEQLILD